MRQVLSYNVQGSNNLVPAFNNTHILTKYKCEFVKYFNECRGQETIRNTVYFHTLMAVYFIKQNNFSESISLTAKDPSL